MCDCGSETETTDHFFLRCPFFMINRQKLLNGFLNKDLSIRNLKDENIAIIIIRGVFSQKKIIYIYIYIYILVIP